MRLAAAELGHHAADVARRRIGAGHRDEAGLGAERVQIAQHVAGAAQAQLLALDMQNRHRRLGRNALDLAADVMVEHDIADAEDARVAKTRDESNEIGVRHAPLLWRRPDSRKGNPAVPQGGAESGHAPY